MARNNIDVGYVAKLARLALTPEETERFGSQLSALLEHVAALSELAVEDVAATAQVVPSQNVARDDIVRPSLERETVLEAAPEREGAYFRVPRILSADEIAGEKT